MPAEMGINMNYAEIKYCDIANGPGVRTSLFVRTTVRDVLMKSHGILNTESRLRRKPSMLYWLH